MNEPDIVQRITASLENANHINVKPVNDTKDIKVDFGVAQQITASFENTSHINVKFMNKTKDIKADFGTVYAVGENRVLYATTETWNSMTGYISLRGFIYIYSDYKKDQYDRDIAGFKVGDGSTYLIDLPFVQETMYEHMENTIIHITQTEREFWNNKVTCYENGHSLIFTKEDI